MKVYQVNYGLKKESIGEWEDYKVLLLSNSSGECREFLYQKLGRLNVQIHQIKDISDIHYITDDTLHTILIKNLHTLKKIQDQKLQDESLSQGDLDFLVQRGREDERNLKKMMNEDLKFNTKFKFDMGKY